MAIVPYGNPKCRICALPIEDIKKIHVLKFDKKFSYKQIREYLKGAYSIGENYNHLCNHFNKHVNQTKLALQKTVVEKHVVEVLNDNKMVHVKTNKDIEQAYTQLVKQAATFANRSKSLLDKFEDYLDKNPDKLHAMFEKSSNINPLSVLEQLARLNKEAREQVKDVSSLRAPKVLVAQFLENTLGEIIREMSDLLNYMCGTIQTEVTNVLGGDKINNELFSVVFRKIAQEYVNRITQIKRDSLSKAASQLNDMEKIL